MENFFINKIPKKVKSYHLKESEIKTRLFSEIKALKEGVYVYDLYDIIKQ